MRSLGLARGCDAPKVEITGTRDQNFSACVDVSPSRLKPRVGHVAHRSVQSVPGGCCIQCTPPATGTSGECCARWGGLVSAQRLRPSRLPLVLPMASRSSLSVCTAAHEVTSPARRRCAKQPRPKNDSPGRSTPSQSPPRSRRNGWLRGAPLARLYDDDAVRQPSRQARDGRRSGLRGEDFDTRAGASTAYTSPEGGWPDVARVTGASCCVMDPPARACPTNC